MTVGQAPRTLRALVVEDEAAFRVLLGSALEGLGYEVKAVEDAEEASRALAEFRPDISLIDLDLGTETSGIDLIYYQTQRFPTVPILIVSAYRSAEFVDASAELPPSIGHITKADIVDLSVLESAMKRSLAGDPPVGSSMAMRHAVTIGQAAVLRMIAEGLSNAEIAELRGCSIRSLERIINRLYQSLELNNNPMINPRVSAARMYRESRVEIRR